MVYRIPDLPAATSAGLSDVLEVEQSGASKHVTGQQLVALVHANTDPSDIGAAAAAHGHAAGDVSGLAAVATSGAYADLDGKPTIPTNNNQLANGAGYVTASEAALAAPVQSVAGKTGVVTLTPADVGAIPASEKGAAGGVATLGAGGLVPVSQLGSGAADGSKVLKGDGTWGDAPTGLDINGLASASPELTDTLPIYDASAAGNRKALVNAVSGALLASGGSVAGNYQFAFGASGSGAGAALSNNRVYLVPFLATAETTYTRIGVDVTSLVASSTVRLGIYSSVNGKADTLLIDAGTVNGDTAGVKEISISHTLPAGVYWLALVSNLGPTLRASGMLSPFFAAVRGTSLLSSAGTYAYYVAGSASLPAGIPSVIEVAGNPPMIWLRHGV